MNISQPAENVVLPFTKAQKINHRDPEALHRHRRIPFVHRLPNKVRVELVALIGEFVGTFMFLFFAFSGTQVANFVAPGASAVSDAPNTSNLLYIALAFGFSLAVNAWVFFRITGGLFNPAVTLGMCLIGAVTWLRGGVVFVAQIAGGIAAAAVVSALFPGPLGVTTGLSTGLNGTPKTSVVRGLFIEMFLTAELVFTIFMLAAEKHKATFIAPIGIGLALFVAELSGVYFTGGSLNPARSFGPAVVAGKFYTYHWIYWVGPGLGAIVAVIFYKLVKSLEYESVNPGQDETEKEEEKFENDDMPRHNDEAASPSDIRSNDLRFEGSPETHRTVSPTADIKRKELSGGTGTYNTSTGTHSKGVVPTHGSTTTTGHPPINGPNTPTRVGRYT